MTNKYLVITIQDNDYTSEGKELGDFIQRLILNELDDPTDIENCLLKDSSYLLNKIANLWSVSHDIWMNLRFGDHQETSEYFMKNIKMFVCEESDLENLDNGEFIVIPLNYVDDAYVR